jgi:hypothetical protein
LLPSVVYRNVPAEPLTAGAKWVGDKSSSVTGDASTAGGESKSGEDDFQVTAKSNSSKKGEESEMENVCLPGEPLYLSPMTGLQPCPLVFFRDAWGDVNSFRFFWFPMTLRVPIRIAKTTVDQRVSPVDVKIAKMACLNFEGQAIPGGFCSKLWAFMTTLPGQRIFCLLAEMESSKGTNEFVLHFRGDDKSVLLAMLGSKSGRESVVAALCPGMGPVE